MKIRWWQWLWLNWLPHWLTRQPIHCIGLVESADEIPETLPKRSAVVVGDPSHLKWIAFDCPCGNGHRIMLNLDRGRSPSWRLINSGKQISLSPSVNYYNGRRRCHYWIKNGKVDWLEDSFGER